MGHTETQPLCLKCRQQGKHAWFKMRLERKIEARLYRTL